MGIYISVTTAEIVGRFMNIEPVSSLAAFTAGLVSVVSPCVLPLLPTYITYLAGSTPDLYAGDLRRHRLHGFLNAFMFVMGFSAVFIAFGLTASAVGQTLRAHAPLLRQLSGLVIIVFGAYLLGIFRWLLLAGEFRPHFQPTTVNPGTSFLLGASFGFGWTPCIGPVLASILILAGSRDTIAAGGSLLAIYSAGLAIPFLAMAVFLTSMQKLLRRLYPILPRVQQAAGALMIVVGLMIMFNVFTLINNYVDWRF